jgi:hypothetical protein
MAAEDNATTTVGTLLFEPESKIGLDIELMKSLSRTSYAYSTMESVTGKLIKFTCRG